MAQKADIDARAFRDAMGKFCTGIVVATAMSPEGPCGFVAQSFVSLSLDPPLVGLCPARTSTSWPKIRDTRHYAINVLAADQRELCNRFASSGGDKFDGIDWQPLANGAPGLAGVLLHIECELQVEHDVGDHTFAVAHVRALDVVRDAPPLLFNAGGYGQFSSVFDLA